MASECSGRGKLPDDTIANLRFSADPPFDPEIVRALFSRDVVVEIARPALIADELFPEELLHIARAVEKRKAEFAAARQCARRALARLGIAPCALVPLADRSPYWPAGVKGSITHTAGCCAVAVTTAPDIVGIGLDIEQGEGLDPKLERLVCTPAELAWLHRHPSDRSLLAKLFFSAKEAFYKCQYGLTRTLLDFQDVEIELDRARQAFRVRDVRSDLPRRHLVRQIAGRFQRVGGYVIAAAMLRSSDLRDEPTRHA
jgi:4'-phosphopantetheinyl transferase EntD